MSPLKRHATASTLGLFAALCFGLSLAPVPKWLRPLDVLTSDAPVEALWSALVTRPRSVPRPSQGYVAGGGALDIAEEDRWVEEDRDAEETTEEVAVRTRDAPPPPETWTPPPRPRFERWAERLGLQASAMEIPCVESIESADGRECRRAALDRFFARLRKLEASDSDLSAPRDSVRIVHYGDSLIASDKITDRARLRLQQRFGSGGPGFLFVRKFNRFQRGHRTGRGTGGWVMEVITQGVLQDRYFGYTGASFTAQAAREEAVFDRLGGARLVEVFHLAEPTGGELEFIAGGQVISTLDTRAYGKPEAARHRFELPEGVDSLTMRAVTHGARVFGVVFESNEVPGVVYESIGLPGATSEVWLRPDAEDFARQLAARNPALVVQMVGGNDVLMLSKRRTDPKSVEAEMRRFWGRIHAAVPRADCLIVSPLESVRAKNDGRLIPKPEVQTVIELQRRVARDAGCAFWDMHASMGGTGSLEDWVQANLMLGDLIHPKSRGSDLLGEMFVESIMDAYDARDGTGREAMN